MNNTVVLILKQKQITKKLLFIFIKTITHIDTQWYSKKMTYTFR